MQWSRVKTYFGRHIYVCRDDFGVSSSVFHTGRWEGHVDQKIRERIGSGDVFLDVGANIGFFSLLAADLMSKGGGGKVIAVEANPLVVPYLMASAVESGLDDLIQVLPYAVSDRTGLVQINGNYGDNLGGTTINHEIDVERKNHFVVPSVRLDDILHDTPALDFVKMDVEGAELLAMKGFKQCVDRFKPDILMELNKQCLAGVSQVSVHGMVSYMEQLGYEPYDFVEGSVKPLSADEVVRIVEANNYYDFMFVHKANYL
jgi:FkbM family methyltransferase